MRVRQQSRLAALVRPRRITGGRLHFHPRVQTAHGTLHLIKVGERLGQPGLVERVDPAEDVLGATEHRGWIVQARVVQLAGH